MFARLDISTFQATNLTEDIIKEKLVQQLADDILANKLVSFTKIDNMFQDSSTFLARAYLVPDEAVRILKTYGHFNK